MGKEVGFILVRDGEVVGLECFDGHETMEDLKECIYGKYALDLATREEAVEDLDMNAIIERFKEELRTAKVTMADDKDNIGGKNVYLETVKLRGTMFVREQRPLYVSIVRKSENKNEPQPTHPTSHHISAD